MRDLLTRNPVTFIKTKVPLMASQQTFRKQMSSAILDQSFHEFQ